MLQSHARAEPSPPPPTEKRRIQASAASPNPESGTEFQQGLYVGCIVNPRKLNMGLGGFVLGSPILYLKGMRVLMFQLSGFYCRLWDVGV